MNYGVILQIIVMLYSVSHFETARAEFATRNLKMIRVDGRCVLPPMPVTQDESMQASAFPSEGFSAVACGYGGVIAEAERTKICSIRGNTYVPNPGGQARNDIEDARNELWRSVSEELGKGRKAKFARRLLETCKFSDVSKFNPDSGKYEVVENKFRTNRNDPARSNIPFVAMSCAFPANMACPKINVRMPPQVVIRESTRRGGSTNAPSQPTVK